MKLQKMILVNRAPFERLELDFDDSNIFVLSGINGAGKTTILSYIVDSFYELAKKGFSNEFETKPNKYYRLSSSLYSLDQSKPSLVYLRYIKSDGSNADYIDLRGEIEENQYQLMIGLSDSIQYSKIKSTLINNSLVKYWSISDAKEIEKIFDSSLTTYFPAYRYEMPSYLNDPYKISLNFKVDSDFSGYLSNPIEVTSDLPQIANWIMDVVLDYREYGGTAQVIFDELSDLLTGILSSKLDCAVRLGIGRRSAGGARIAIMNKDKKSQIYPSIFNMSSGELALVCLFGELIKQSDKINEQISNVSGIVLVDEIDKHLHIKLQKETLPKLMGMFPNIQFIVSSHSPFLGLGLEIEAAVTYKIYDLDNGGICCPPQNNELFNDVYNMMISQNEQFMSKYTELCTLVQENTKPLIVTEGKTDWKHLLAAKRKLDIDLDIEFYRYNGTLGDKTLLQLLKDYARIPQNRKIIGIFDRDNFQELKCEELENQRYVDFKNNVYGFAIPTVHDSIYGFYTSIEHYYDKKDLQKITDDGRRIFLGEEFTPLGISKDGNYITKFSNYQNKMEKNGVIDEKVYCKDDGNCENSVALSKNSFAEAILNQDPFADNFDFSEFTKIFDVIREICQNENSP